MSFKFGMSTNVNVTNKFIHSDLCFTDIENKKKVNKGVKYPIRH